MKRLSLLVFLSLICISSFAFVVKDKKDRSDNLQVLEQFKARLFASLERHKPIQVPIETQEVILASETEDFTYEDEDCAEYYVEDLDSKVENKQAILLQALEDADIETLTKDIKNISIKISLAHDDDYDVNVWNQIFDIMSKYENKSVSCREFIETSKTLFELRQSGINGFITIYLNSNDKKEKAKEAGVLSFVFDIANNSSNYWGNVISIITNFIKDIQSKEASVVFKEFEKTVVALSDIIDKNDDIASNITVIL